MYDKAEKMNIVIESLREHGFAKQIDKLFLLTIPTRKTARTEIRNLKLSSVSTAAVASETVSFNIKLQEKIDITFDQYADNVIDDGDESKSGLISNNTLNTAHHNRLLNRGWYEKIKSGELSNYVFSNQNCMSR